MKKVSIKVLSLLLVVMTLVGVISLPVSAEIGYPMTYTIYYKVGGKFLGQAPKDALLLSDRGLILFLFGFAPLS